MYPFIKIKIIVLVLALHVCAFSQVVTNVRHYTTAEGLSDNRITNIIKDKDGFMWFGSWAGITRFDGFQFVTYKSYPGDRSSLESNRIDEIVEDPNSQHFWLKAYDKRIYRFDKRTGEIESLSKILHQPALSKISFTRIWLVNASEIWLQSERMGLYLISNPDKGQPGITIFASNKKSDQKLPSNSIDFFQLDKNGSAWVGTRKGLVRIRREADNTYKAVELPSTAGKEITSFVSVEDNTWILGGAGTLTGVDKHLSKIGEIKFASSINKISVSKRQKLFYCTTLSGELYSVTAKGKATLLMKTKDASSLSYVFEDSGGNLWIESASSAVIKYDLKNKTIEHLFPKNAYPYNPKLINYSMFEDKDARVWININRRLYVFQPESGRVFPLEKLLDDRHQMLPETITRIFYDKAGVLWIGSGYDGISKVVFQEQAFTRKMLVPAAKTNEDNDVRGVLFDSNSRLWAGTKAGKLFVEQKNLVSESALKGQFINKAGIYSICEDAKKNIWFGTKADGLVQAIPSQSGQGSYLVNQYIVKQNDQESISSNSIYCLFKDWEGRLWAGSFDEGLILINSTGGKTAFKTLKNSFKNYPKEGFRKIRHIAQDSKGLIWVGATDGLLIFNPNSATPDQYVFRTYRKEAGNIHSLGGNDVQFILRDSDNNMWVLTTTGGLNLASSSNPLRSLSFMNFSVKNGLPSDYLLSGVEDGQKNLWIASQNGLLKFSLKERKWQTFNRNDGLGTAAFSEASCTRAEDGRIAFGTSSGLVTFYPQQIRSSQTYANLALCNLQVNSQDILPGQGSPLKYTINETRALVLKHDQNSISIDFAVLDFHSTENQNFAYRLVGFDNVWRNSAGQRRATYTKLPPGDYTFEVKSLNDELYKKVPFKSLKIVVSSPFWLTWWAYLLYAILFVMAALLVRRVVATVLKLRQSVEVEKRLAELKLNFFTQISHELRTPLTLIINPIEEIRKSNNLSKKENSYISVVINNAQRMLRLVNQVLDLRKVQSGSVSMNWEAVEIIGFINNIIDYFRETLTDRDIKVEVRTNTPKLLVNIDRDKIEIVVYNLLANAIKFSDNGSSILVRIMQSDEHQNLTLEVVDQGPGVDDAELDKIFQLYYEGKQKKDHQAKGSGIGLALSKELVELHGGKIYASNHNKRGLTVGFVLPLYRHDTLKLTPQTANEINQNHWMDEEQLSFATSEEPSQAINTMSRLVLIVEDNDELRLFLSSKLSETYRVETAINGLEGLSKARSLSPDLILSDVMMPEMDGIEMLDAVKSDSAISHIPVILLTAKYSVKTRLQGLQYGADYYITKPFKMELLEGAVNAIISRRQKVLRDLLIDEDASTNDPEIAPAAEADVSVAEPEVVMTELDKNFLGKVIAIIEEKLSDSQFNIEDVVDQLNMSRSTFYRKVKSLTNLTPVELVREVRLKKVKDLFDAGEVNISSVAYEVGFTNPKYLTYCFKNRYNQNPSDYIKSVKKRYQN